MDPALVALSLLPAHTALAVAEGLRSGGPASAVLARVVSACWPGDPSRYGRLMARGRRAVALGASSGLRAIAWGDSDYPSPLAAIPDPPPLLWVRGAVEALQLPAVAIVGSRAATPYALEVSARLAAGLAGRGVAVVSGLARGVDSAAHRGAVASGGSTIAVLGCGADRVYPPEHAELAHEIEGRGVVMSELAPGTPPLPRFFPRRNRIISGLARAVVVVEAGERSGSLITARAALDQGREVMAVPGSVLSGRNRGGHGLLRDGARLVETAGDVIEELYGVGARGPEAPARGAPTGNDPVLTALGDGEACDLDTIAERAGLDASRVLPRLLELELRGAVARAGGGRFIRVGGSW